ncbi:hypothetical protein L798_13031 [Zootermopsis nevadensis]|uniref:Uncharacterized protein n=1 Tax=Zootermopsis nevadensis TaxID=136037 RepID=A0A067R4Y6_ZOONE|nr:hypothetical protein L798_13031 [Zootermopsis nevadensis]
MDKIGKSVRKLWKAMGKQIRSSKPTKAGRRWKDIYRLGKKSSRSEDQTASTYRSKPLDDSAGCSSAPQNFESVDLNEQIRSVDDVDRAANLRRCPALEEDCVAVRWERDALKRTVKELEIKLQVKQGTLERRNLYLEEDPSALFAENNSFLAEVQDLHDARTTETSEMMVYFGKQTTVLADRLLAEILAIERSFVQANSDISQVKGEMRIYEDAFKLMQATFEALVAEKDRLETKLRNQEGALIAESAAMVKERLQKFASKKERLWRKVLDIGRKNVTLKKDLQFTDEENIYEASNQQLEETVADQITELCVVKPQTTNGDENQNEQSNGSKSLALKKEDKNV